MIVGNKSDLSGRVVGYDQASSFAKEVVVEIFVDLKNYCWTSLKFDELKMILSQLKTNIIMLVWS